MLVRELCCVGTSTCQDGKEFSGFVTNRKYCYYLNNFCQRKNLFHGDILNKKLCSECDGPDTKSFIQDFYVHLDNRFVTSRLFTEGLVCESICR